MLSLDRHHHDQITTALKSHRDELRESQETFLAVKPGNPLMTVASAQAMAEGCRSRAQALEELLDLLTQALEEDGYEYRV